MTRRLRGLVPLAVVALVWPSFLRAQQPAESPRLEVPRDTLLVDEPVRVRALGLAPGTQATLRTSAVDARSLAWSGEATFAADAGGAIDPSSQAPLAGTYAGTDPWGLFWSMRPGGALPAGHGPGFARDWPGVARFEVALLVDGRIVARDTVARRFASAGVRMTRLTGPGPHGFYFEPPGPGPYPAVLALHGTGGPGNIVGAAPLLASHGFAVLVLQYAYEPPLPASITDVPLELFDSALAWLARRPGVDARRLAVIGISKGGEAALLVGSRHPEVRAVVGIVPSGIAWEGASVWQDGRLVTASPGRPSWTEHGRPVPYLRRIPDPAGLDSMRQGCRLCVQPLFRAALRDRAAVARATIPVERIGGPVLLLSARADRVWPSVALSEIAVARLRRRGFRFPFEHVAYDDAGHLFSMTGFAPFVLGDAVASGTPEGNARAGRDAWARIRVFLDRSLAGLPAPPGSAAPGARPHPNAAERSSQ